MNVYPWYAPGFGRLKLTTRALVFWCHQPHIEGICWDSFHFWGWAPKPEKRKQIQSQLKSLQTHATSWLNFSYLFNPSTKMIQSIGMDVSTCHITEEILFWKWSWVSFDEKHSLIFQRWWPICMGHQMPRKILADDQFLGKKNLMLIIYFKCPNVLANLRQTSFNKTSDESSLLIRNLHSSPFVWFDSQGF